MSVQRFQHGSGATYVLESDYLATVADADLRYENGARNQRLIDEARIRDLEARFKEIGAMIPAHGGGTFVNDPPDAIVDAMRRFLGPVAASALETK